MYSIITRDDESGVALMSDFIAHHKSGHFLQSPQWAQVKKNWRWRGILAYDRRGRPAGAVSVLIRPLPLGLSLLYAPRGPVCDRDDAYIVHELLRGVKSLARTCHAPLFLTDPDADDGDARFRELMLAEGFEEKQSDSLNNIQAQYVFRLSLEGRCEDEIFAAFAPKTRYNIRLARRRGVEIRAYPGSEPVPDEALDAFSRLMEETGARDRFLTRGGGYFRRVMASLGDSAVLFLACLDGEPIAGTIGVYYDRKAWYLYGASSNGHRDAMPNHLLQWEMIRRAARLGCSFYDLRGVPGGTDERDPLFGLYRFKRGFSGEYTKFTGLFIKKYAPLAGSAMMWLWRAYQRVQWRRVKGRPLLVPLGAADRQHKNLSPAC